MARRAGAIARAAALCACLALPASAAADHPEVLRHGDPGSAFDGGGVPAEPAEGGGPVFESAVPGACPVVDRGTDDSHNAVFPAAVPAFKVIYAHPTDVPNRIANVGPIIQAGVKAMSDLVESESGGALSPRFDLGTFEGPGCVDIQRIALPRTTAAYLNPASSFGRLAGDVASRLGAQPPIRNYFVYADAVPLPGIAGIAERYDSDAADGSTSHNLGNLFAVLYGRAGTDFFGSGTFFPAGTTSRRHLEIALHELTHNLGGVQSSAPHSTGTVGPGGPDAGHCYDEFDLECYDDGGDAWIPLVDPNCDGAATPPPDIYSDAEEAWDCNKDDYFSMAPPLGSYLDTNWNTRNSVFLCAVLSCTPPDTISPETSIDKAPKRRTRAKRVKVAFSATERATFTCRLDGRAPRPCTTPFKTRIKRGKHRVRVFATDRAGNSDPTPAVAKFRRAG